VPRLPIDAFAQFVAMGPQRSYAALARQLGVTKRSVSRLAVRDQWQERLDKIESDARIQLDAKLAESIQAVNSRHVKTARLIMAKGIEALRSMPLQSAMAAVKAIEIAIKVERLVLVEPETSGAKKDAAGRQSAAREAALEIREALRAMDESVPTSPARSAADDSADDAGVR